MTPTRRTYLEKRCHDNALALRVAKKCGKRIPDLETVAELFQILEEILRDVER